MFDFRDFFEDIASLSRGVDTDQLIQIANIIDDVSRGGGRLFLFGNGGSYAIASHLSVDFSNAAGVRVGFANDPSMITCFSNDYGYENWVARAISETATSKDIVILISSSGSSQNMVNAGNLCRKRAIALVTFSGFSANNDLRQLGDWNLWVDSRIYNVVENVHTIWLTSIVDYLKAKVIT